MAPPKCWCGASNRPPPSSRSCSPVTFVKATHWAPARTLCLRAPLKQNRTEQMTKELQADILIVGGGLGGVAAALGALRAGRSVIMTEEFDWIGGQLTSQAVPPDEHSWVEQFGITRSYRQLRTGIRQYYRDHYPLTEASRAWGDLNP